MNQYSIKDQLDPPNTHSSQHLSRHILRRIQLIHIPSFKIHLDSRLRRLAASAPIIYVLLQLIKPARVYIVEPITDRTAYILKVIVFNQELRACSAVNPSAIAVSVIIVVNVPMPAPEQRQPRVRSST